MSALQSITYLGRRTNTRWLISIVVSVWFLTVLLFYHPSRKTITTTFSTVHSPLGHPIEQLIREKRAQFESLQAKQSKTILEATAEYRRRYKRAPPRGFEAWFSLAQEHDFVLPDEFDTFMSSLEPYHGISSYILRERLRKASAMASDRLALLHIRNGRVEVSESADTFIPRLANMTGLEGIPYNMTILLNFFDEPMVSAHHEEIDSAMAAIRSGTKLGSPAHSDTLYVEPLLDTSGQAGWAAQSRACPYDSPSRQLSCPRLPDNAPITFISNLSASDDVCTNCALRSQHGMILMPESLLVAHELVPIFSSSKPSHFHDLLYPTTYYTDERYSNYNESLDPDWENKDRKFYWAGSSTGGRNTIDNWDMLHRQRMVLKTQARNSKSVPVLRETEPGRWTQESMPMTPLAEKYFQTRISRLVQCQDNEVSSVQEVAFNTDDPTLHDEREDAYRHQFLIDVDGNGFSGRYYRLLGSKSVVVKQTILREWHDDRLMPWVHYIPLSTGYEELPEMARFMAGTETGQRLSERMARESTEWSDVALREVDLQIARVRILLEYGRLMSEDSP